MRGILIGALGATVVVVALMAQGGSNANPKPTCNMCPGTYIPLSELDAYRQKAIKENLVDQQVRDIDGTATLKLGPAITNMVRRPATQETVRLFNGPGNNGSEITNGKSYNLKPGDVIVIPAGTGHQFTKIDDHIDYLMVRIDPDKVTPLRDEAASQQYLKTGKQPGASN
ncbi:MAG: hypothetical protein DMF87_02945 [Acidobacteria bacterium]|nr:MAG: hypothetical protein DMF87_02945 [Acidobacteriota bacterium]